MNNIKTLIICLVVLTAMSFIPAVKAAGISNASGYAWSETIGWIDFAPVFGGVQVDTTIGGITGYAWSEHIGWVDFNPAGPYPASPNYSAQLDPSTGNVSGWAKAISADNNGWDGWISMSGSTTGSCVSGYTYNSSSGMCEKDPTCPVGGTYDPVDDRCEATGGGADTYGAWVPASCGGFTPPNPDLTKDTCDGDTWIPYTCGASENKSCTDMAFFGNLVGCKNRLVECESDCPPGYVGIGGGICTASATCSDGGVLNTATDKCELSPTGISSYGVNINLSTGDFSGWAWGSDVVGWLSFSGTNYKVSLTSQCSDGIDNDGDTFVDYPNDIGCTSATDNDETNPACSDGIDNDGDTFIDYPNDIGCTSATDDDETDVADFNLMSSNDIFVTLVDGTNSQSTETTITVSPIAGFSSDVVLSVESVSPSDPGFTFNFGDTILSSPEYSTGSQFSITVPGAAGSGLYAITIRGDAGGLIRTTVVNLNVESIEPGWEEF